VPRGGVIAKPLALRYQPGMDTPQDPRFFKHLIDQAESYHDLAVFRSRFFNLIERTLSKDDCQGIKDHWSTRARDENLPIAPSKG